MKRLIFFLSAVLFAGCASTDIKVRPGATPPNPAADKFIIMPVDIHGLPGDKMAQEAALFAGFVAAFKDSGIPLQPIKPALEAAGYGNLSWELAEGMYHLVDGHNEYDFTKDATFHGGKSELPIIVEGIAKVIGLAAEQLKLDFKPKYVAVAHIDSASSSLPKTIGYRVIVGVYNVEASKIDRVAYYEKTTADDEKAILAEMATLGSECYDKLFGDVSAVPVEGDAPAEGGEAAPAEAAPAEG